MMSKVLFFVGVQTSVHWPMPSERLGAIPARTLEAKPTGEGGIAPNIEGRRRYWPVRPSQTHGIDIVIK